MAYNLAPETMRFEWDEEKSSHCEAQRGFGFAYAARIFLTARIERIDARQDYGETRLRTAGVIEGRPYLVVFTRRGGAIRIISARRMHAKEWEEWQR